MRSLSLHLSLCHNALTHLHVHTSVYLIVIITTGAMTQDALFQCSIDVYVIKVIQALPGVSAPVVREVVSSLPSLHRSVCDGVHDVYSAIRALVHMYINHNGGHIITRLNITTVDLMGSLVLDDTSYRGASTSSSSSIVHSSEWLDMYRNTLLPALQQSITDYLHDESNHHQGQINSESRGIQITNHLVQAPVFSSSIKINQSIPFSFDKKVVEKICNNRDKEYTGVFDVSDSDLYLSVSCPLISSTPPSLSTKVTYTFDVDTESQCMYISHTLQLLSLSFTERVIPISGKWRSGLLRALRSRLMGSYKQLQEKRRRLKMGVHCVTAVHKLHAVIAEVDIILGNVDRDVKILSENDEMPLPFMLAIMKVEKFLGSEKRWRGYVISPFYSLDLVLMPSYLFHLECKNIMKLSVRGLKLYVHPLICL